MSTATATAKTSTVGVVVVNYNGGDLTLDCLHSIVRSDWPAAHLRVVLVDNAALRAAGIPLLADFHEPLHRLVHELTAS